MSKEIYISTTPHETRLAIVEDEQLAEIYYERENEYTLAGSIYNGKVTRVLPGMQSAFVDVGLERDAFLYVTDFMEEQGDAAEFESDSGSRRTPQAPREPSAERPAERHDSGRRERSPFRDTPRAAPEPTADPTETVSFDEPIAPHPTDDLATDADGQGSRRWRGRRGRRRGRGSNREASPASASDTATADTDTQHADTDAQPMESQFMAVGDEELSYSIDASAAIEIDLEAAPEASPQRGRDASRGGRDQGGHDRGGRDRGGRGGERGRRDSRDVLQTPAYTYGQEEEAPAVSGAPVLLPGESIRKYRDPVEVAAEDAERQAKAPKLEALPSSTPAMEIAGWDGGAVLPGETLSRHRGRSSQSAPAPIARMMHTQAPADSPAQPAMADQHTAEQEQATHVAAEIEHLPTPIADVETIAASAAPEETGGLTQLPNQTTSDDKNHVEQASFAADRTHENDYEPGEGDRASVETKSSPNYLRSEQPSTTLLIEDEAPAAPVNDSTYEPSPASEITAVEHDQTTYDLDASAEQVTRYSDDLESLESGAQEHSFTTLQPTGEMLSDSGLAEQTAPASQDSGDAANPILSELAVQSVSRADAETTPELPVAEPGELVAESGNQALPQIHAYGDGELLEEEIDGDEYEFEAALGSLDELEVEEYEEETLHGSTDLASMLQDIATESHTDTEEEHKPAYASDAGDFTVDDFGGEPEEDEEVIEQPTQTGTDQRSRRDSQPQRGSRDRRPGQRGNDRGRGRKSMQVTDMPAINDLLKPGQEILVQIAKEPIAKKGARITSHIALPGRFLVFMPTVNHTGVSRKISSEEERRRLKSILISEKGDATGGFIVRTAADGASEEELRNDLRFLIHLWDDIKARSEGSKSPALIYHDLNLIERILRDQVTDNFSAIWVDTEAEYERVLRFLQRFQPSLVRRVKLYTKETPLFEHFAVTQEIEKALKSKVWLKSGGSIVINQTEALVAIDINTGKYVGKTARLEDTILKTNLDSIPEIVRQIRLRDLGGIIVIDFIDMDERKNRTKVLQALEDELKSDRAPSKVLPFNDFGLVIMTRKRVKQSLERTLCIPDPITEGTGMIKSPITVSNEIFIEMRRMHRHIEKGDILLRVHPEVVKQLKSNGGKRLQELEEMTHKTILVKSDPSLNPEQFDIH